MEKDDGCTTGHCGVTSCESTQARTPCCGEDWCGVEPHRVDRCGMG